LTLAAIFLGLALSAATALARAATLDEAAAPAGNAAQSDLAAEVDASGPSRLIETAATAMLTALDQHRTEYRRNPQELHQLVNEVLLPHLDTRLSAQLVLGRHWRAASAEQRRRFIGAFYKSMLDQYGDALLDFTANQLKVFPYRGEVDAQYATVRSRVRKSDGSFVEVDYSVRRTNLGWKVWDVAIEGVSYVLSFRDDFNTEIEQKGLDHLISRLEAE
jgi:phospholipid transport system substrate-binding protein